MLLILAAAPLSIAVIASFLGWYPMTNQVRMIMWLLPCVAVPLAAAAKWLPPNMIVVLCAGAVIAGQLALIRAPHHNEKNREALSVIRAEFADASLFHAEVADARTHLRGNSLWVISPEPEAGQWMGVLRTTLAEIPARMAETGCALEWERRFDRSRVQRYRCSR